MEYRGVHLSKMEKNFSLELYILNNKRKQQFYDNDLNVFLVLKMILVKFKIFILYIIKKYYL